MRRFYTKTRKRIWQVEKSLFLCLMFLALFSYLTNPFTKFSVVDDPWSIMDVEGSLNIQPINKLYVIDNRIVRALASFKSGWHILTNRFSWGEKLSNATSLSDIINTIHQLRFSPNAPYLISGDHFSMLYPRSLGIFYHATLDPRTALNDIDWLNRQKIYLKTTLFALEAFKNAKNLSTTITTIGPQSVTLINWFTMPSDTLYSVLYALQTLLSSDEYLSRYPYQRLDGKTFSLETEQSTHKIITEYKTSLQRHYNTYVTVVTDPTTGLIKKDLVLSSTKDSVIRASAFYDNVILWKTHSLAQQLGITALNPKLLTELKQKILTTFWLPTVGYFLEDLNDTAIAQQHYSSDWLIAYLTGFLNPNDPNDRNYLTKSIEFIQQQKLDRPFALKYEPTDQQNKLHMILRLSAKQYGTKAIWSNWGMEYVKLLTQLFQITCNEKYLKEAQFQLRAYRENIITFHGYPEVYDLTGKPYRTPLYKSVHQTGWVVSFEQAQAMFDYTVSNSCNLPSKEKINLQA